MFTVGTFAIIFDKNKKVLLGHRRDLDLWDLPGGGVESGELPNEAVIRETKEETGLEAVVERFIGVYGKNHSDDIVFTFICRVTGGQLTVTDESDDHQYFAVNDLPRNTNPKQVERVQDAISLNSQPVFRRQIGPPVREWLKTLENTDSSI